jgi:hypothetical protein
MPPYDYNGSVIALDPHDSSMMVTLFDCPQQESEGDQVIASLPFAALSIPNSQRSADGLDYTGTAPDQSGLITWSWALRGAP